MNPAVLSLLRRALPALLRRHDDPAPHDNQDQRDSEGAITFATVGRGAQPDDGQNSHPPAEAFDNSERAEISFGPLGNAALPDDGQHSHPPAEAFDNGERAGKG